MSKFTKAEIIDAIYNKTGTSRKEIRDVVDSFIEEVKAALVSGNVIELRGFGTFEIKIRKGRQKARNPKTGEILSVNSHGIAAFRPGRELKQAVWVLKDTASLPENSAARAVTRGPLLPLPPDGEPLLADSTAPSPDPAGES